MEKMTQEQLLTAHKTVETARESDSPFVVRADDGMQVIGNPNKTEVKKTNHVVTFRFVKDELEQIPENAKIVDKYVICKIEYNDISLDPRNDILLIRSLQKLVGVFTDLDELLEEREKKVQELHMTGLNQNSEEYKKKVDEISLDFGMKLMDLYAYSSDEARDSMYDFVAKLLDLSDFMKDHMLSTSVLTCFTTFIVANPNLWNEAESLFGY